MGSSNVGKDCQVGYIALMATRNVNLTDTLDRFVEDRVHSGDFQNASEVVRAGLRLLKAQAEREQLKLDRFRALVQAGLDDLEGGRFDEVDDVAGWLGERGRGASPA